MSWVEEMLWNVTYLFLYFLVVKTDLLNVISRNIIVYKNVTMTLNKHLLDDKQNG
jgi:hypothetical protein